MADFKVEKHYSRIDIVFLAVCALIMFLPVSHITDAKKSDKENRNLAVWRPFIKKDGTINYNFGRDYDKWFSDRFNLRNLLISINSTQDLLLNNKLVYANHFMNKSTGEMYQLFEAKRTTIPEKQIQEAILGLKTLKDFCDENKITPYIILLPRKMDVYKQEALPFTSHNQEIEDKKLVERLVAETGMNILFMYDVINEHKYEQRVYYKSDPHFTDYATMLYYNSWLNEVKKDYSSFGRLTLDDFNVDLENRLVKLSSFSSGANGAIYKALNLPDKKADKILKDKFPLYEYKNMKSVDISTYYKDDFEVITYDTRKDKWENLFITGTSNSPTFSKIAPFGFNKTTFVKMFSGRPDTYSLMKYKDIIKNSGSNILVGVYTITNVADFVGFAK